MPSETERSEVLPIYGEKPASPGLYLGLFHGRDEARQKMDGWGFDGPMIGPLKWFHTTYACTLRISFERSSDAERFFGMPDTDHILELDGDLLVFGGKYYGDWTVYKVDPENCERPEDTFRRNQRSVGHWAHSSCIG